MSFENLREIVNRCVDVEGVSPRLVRVGETLRRDMVQEVRGVDEENRTITFVASTEAVDRYGDVIRVKGWKTGEYMKNPVFLWAHKSGEPPIGKTVKLTIENNPPALIQVVEFADAKTYPFADTIFQLYKNKFLRSVSVGFRPLSAPEPIIDKETGRFTGYEYANQELLELSAVPIPANPEAIARAISAGVMTADDAPRFFRAVEPEENIREELELAGLRLAFATLEADLLQLEAAITLRSLAAPRKSEMDAFMTALAAPQINTVQDLESALRGN